MRRKNKSLIKAATQMGVGALKGPSLILARSSKCSSVKEAWGAWEVEVMNKIFPLAAQVVILDFEFMFLIYTRIY